MIKLIAPGHSLRAHSPATSLIGSPSLTGSSTDAIFNSPLNTTFPATSVPSDISLNQEDYPNVKFWCKQDWLNHVKENGNSTDVTEITRGKSLISKGINKSVKYIEDTEGTPIDGYRLRDIRSHARALWATFQSLGRLPPSWGKADAEIARTYRREMRLKFPEFALCENDWKADFLATENYPSWFSTHVKGTGIKITASPLLTGVKRPLTAESSTNVSSKKSKVPLLFSDVPDI